MGPNCFSDEQYAKLAEILKEQLESCFLRQKNQHLKRQDEDYDEQVEEELEAEASNHSVFTVKLWAYSCVSLVSLWKPLLYL